MASRVFIITTVSIVMLCLQDGNAQFDSLCTPRKSVAVTMPELEGTWYLVMMVNAKEEEKSGVCIETKYEYDTVKNAYVNIKIIFQNGSDVNITSVSDVTMMSPGEFKITPISDPNIQVRAVFVDYLPNDSFISSHCELRNGTLYTDRITVTVRQRNLINLDSIRSRLQSIGITSNNENEWLIQQDKCKN